MCAKEARVAAVLLLVDFFGFAVCCVHARLGQYYVAGQKPRAANHRPLSYAPTSAKLKRKKEGRKLPRKRKAAHGCRKEKRERAVFGLLNMKEMEEAGNDIWVERKKQRKLSRKRRRGCCRDRE